MGNRLVARCLLIFALLFGALLLNAQTGWPYPSGASLPGTCSVGQGFYLTTGAAANTVYSCTAANTWSVTNSLSQTAAALCPSDGTTDATSCLQGYLTSNQTVFLPASQTCYYVNGSLTLKTGQTLYGAQTFLGGSSSQICQHSTTADTLVAASVLSGARKVSIHDLQLLDSVISTRTAGAAIHIDGNGAASANDNAEIDIHNVYAVGFYDGFWGAALLNSTITGNRMSLSKRYGFFITSTQENTSATFTSNYSDGAASGCYRIHSLSYSSFISNACDQVTSGDGYHFQPGQTSGLTLTNATWAASVATFTLNTTPNTELVPGEQFAVSGVSPSGYNYNDYIALTVSGTTVTAALASNPGSYVSGGAFIWGNNIRGVALVSNGDEFASAHGMYLDGEEIEVTGGALSAATGFSDIFINGANSVRISNSVRMNGGDYCVNVNTTPTHNFPVWYYSIVVDHPYCISYVTAMFKDSNRIMQIPQKVRVGVDEATTADLGTATYSNTAGGAGGYGATITNGGAQAALQVDGVTVVLYDRVLVKNQTSALQNGIYLVTTVGTGATNWVLTRDPNYSTAPDMYSSAPIPVRNHGSTNANTLWHMNAVVNTIGTDSITFTQDH